ncbi:MAG: hypothetical protein NTX59_03930 [Elusimicrobia bacterium]|nr:hypothetical protein [Elusimicrobiota bacterium]
MTRIIKSRGFVFLGLAAGFLALYRFTASWLFSYDGVTHALSVEYGPTAFLFHPNHLLHGVFGRLVFNVAGYFGHFRAIFLLQKINALVAAAALGVYGYFLSKRFDMKTACLAVFALGTSYAFWSQAVDPGAYAWVALFTSLLMVPLLATETGSPAAWGALHGAAILFHQMFVLAVPAMLWRMPKGQRKRFLAALFLTAGVPYAVIALAFHGHSLNSAIFWLFAPAGPRPNSGIFTNSWWSTDLPDNALRTAESLRQMWIAPSSGLKGPFSRLLDAALWAAVLSTAFRKWRLRTGMDRVVIERLFIWAFVFYAFQFFWLSGEPRFRIFTAPVLLLALLESGLPGRSTARLTAAAALFLAIAAINFKPLLFQSVPDNNPNMVRLHWARQTLNAEDFLLYYGGGERSVTNVYMVYFAGDRNARSMQGYVFDHLHGDFKNLDGWIEQARRAGGKIWMEESLYSAETQAGLSAAAEMPPKKMADWMAKWKPVQKLEGPSGFNILQVRQAETLRK